jgi:hypothetical protein
MSRLFTFAFSLASVMHAHVWPCGGYSIHRPNAGVLKCFFYFDSAESAMASVRAIYASMGCFEPRSCYRATSAA